MTWVTTNHSALCPRQMTPDRRLPILSVILKACREVSKELFDPYRPELHYMRGPGPKWREKHGAPAANRSHPPDAKPAGLNAVVPPGIVLAAGMAAAVEVDDRVGALAK
jgi:hypothetical protein